MSERQVGTDEAVPSKPWWQSRTIIGVAVMLLSQALRHFKVDIVDSELSDMLTLAMDAFGAALAIYGRVNARKALKLTVPGGKFNPLAEVRRGKRNSGAAAGDTLASVAFVFVMLGVVLFFLPILKSQPFSAEPERIGNRPVAEWVQIVPVEDKRPFFVRLLASIRCSATPALVTTEGGSSVRIVKVEFTGGATF